MSSERLERLTLNIYFQTAFKMEERYFKIDIMTYLNVWMSIGF